MRTLNRGYTLLQLLIVLSIVALLAVSGLSSLQHTVLHNRQRVFLHRLTHLITHAQSIAIVSHHDVCLCPSEDGQECQSVWSSGIRLFEKASQHTRHYWQFTAKQQLRWQGFQDDAVLCFSAQIARSAVNGHFDYQVASGEKIETIMINRLGHWRQASSRQ